MKIKITKGEEQEILEGDYEYIEGKSRQVGRPSFFIATDNFEIDFSSESVDEIDDLIKNLKDIRNNFE